MTAARRGAERFSRYRQLDEAQILSTIDRLQARIVERFPGSGLARLATEFRALAGEAVESVAFLQAPHWPIRLGAGLLIALLLAVVIAAATILRVPTRVDGWAQLVQVIESAVNDVVFIGLAIWFLVSVEGRLKRHRALRALHELRSVVHIVDMHQLTKDPERLRSDFVPTDATVDIGNLDRSQMEHYLEYCSELLSLIGKVAALCAEESQDSLVLTTVSDLETLTTSMSRKVWQKISLLPDVPVRPLRD